MFSSTSMFGVSLFLLMFASSLFGQDIIEGDKVYRMVPSGNGMTKEYVGRVGEPPADKMLDRIHRHRGLRGMLDSLSSNNLDLLIDDELTSEQKASLSELVEQFNVSKTGDVHVARAKFLEGIRATLIPEQLFSMLERFDGSKLPMTYLLGSSIGAEVELSAPQREALLKSCESVNKEAAELLRDFHQKMQSLRSTLLDKYTETLTDSQKTKFEKKVRVKEIIKEMSLSELLKDTQFAKGVRK